MVKTDPQATADPKPELKPHEPTTKAPTNENTVTTYAVDEAKKGDATTTDAPTTTSDKDPVASAALLGRAQKARDDKADDEARDALLKRAEQTRQTRAAAEEDPEPTPRPGKDYIVQGGPIAPWGNSQDAVDNNGTDDEGAPIARLYHPGERVRLTAKLANHYNKINRLAPVIEDDDD